MKRNVLIVLGITIIFTAGIGWRFMTSFENSINCEIYDKIEFDRILQNRNKVPVTEPTYPVPVQFTFDLWFTPPKDSIFEIRAQTAPYPTVIDWDKFSYPIEYRGPFSKSVEVILSRETPDQEDISKGVSFLLIMPSKLSMCGWQAEASYKIIDFTKKYHFHVELLDHRFIEGDKLPSSFRIKHVE